MPFKRIPLNRVALLASLLALPCATLASDEIIIDDGGALDTDIVIDDGIGADPSGDIVIDSGGDSPVEDGEFLIGDDSGTPVAIEAQPGPKTTLTFSLDKARLEFGQFVDSSATSDQAYYGHLSATANWQPNPTWEVQLAGRVDGFAEHGDDSFSNLHGDYGDSFVRYRGENTRITLGSQTVIWGRMDSIPLSDRVSTPDIRRGIQDELEDKRVSTPMLRVERYFGSSRLDLVWLYDFREAKLADDDSVWHPVDRRRGRLLGILGDDVPAAAVQNAHFFDDEPSGNGGFGARFTHTHSIADVGVTVARTRQPLPYFRSRGADYVAEYPRSWTVGADSAIDAAGATWRAELVYNSAIPITRSNYEYTTTESINWGAGVEFHPGDGNTRVIVQLMGRNYIDAPSMLDRTTAYNINGEVSVPFDRERWRLKVNYLLGIDDKNIYVNPELTFLGFEPHEFYVAAHYLDGDEHTIGGFYEDNSSINVGWRAKF